ncbi:MAG TPA: hypothetical protein H9881_17685 [Candidatus Stackebrandtia excrementipullorum]|nr:hypothetical protein [Candidatus Stackebrandtia excrementipullorum]
MADQNPRGQGDNGDDIVAAAFASYRSGVPKHFEPPPSAAIMTGPAPPPRRRGLTLSMAGLAFTGLMVAGVAVAQTITLPTPDDSGVVGAESTDDVGGLDHSETAAQPDNSSTTAPTEPDPVESELLSLSISLPDWPGRLAERCPAGEYTFESYDSPDGTTSNKPNSPAPTRDDQTMVDPETWVLLPGETHAVVGDLDGEEGDEVIVPVACGDVPGVIALYQDEESFTTVEFVYAGTRHDDPIAVASVEDSVVTLSFPTQKTGKTDLRAFTFDGEQFNETTPVDEPTNSPTDKPSDAPSSPSPSDSEDESPGDGDDGDTTESDASQTNSDPESSRSLEETSVPG